MNEMNEILELLGQLSDDSLATDLTEAIRNFRMNRPNADEAEIKKFLHELRDFAVHTGGASQFVMEIFAAIIGGERSYPSPCNGDYSREAEWLAQWKEQK